MQLPLMVTASLRDTLPTPTPLSAGDFLAERADPGLGLRSFGTGIALGVAAVAMRGVVAPRSGTGESRWVVAALVPLSGVVGLLVQRPGRPLLDHIATNQARREAWDRRVAAVTAENIERRRATTLWIHAGRAVPIACGAL
jgi:hypothetical protein